MVKKRRLRAGKAGSRLIIAMCPFWPHIVINYTVPTGALNRASSDEVMNELLALNHDGTTIMCVTHDSKVAAKCSRVLYIVDGGIVGEKEMGHFGGGDNEFRDRERELNNWLMEQGW